MNFDGRVGTFGNSAVVHESSLKILTRFFIFKYVEMTEQAQYRTFVDDVPGHECQLDTKDAVETALFGGEAGGGGFVPRRQRCAKALQRTLLLSRRHPYCALYFKSTNAFALEVLRHVREAPTTIHPLSDFRSSWEIFMVVFYIWYFVLVPYVMVFNLRNNSGMDTTSSEFYLLRAEMVLILMTRGICWMEIIVNFFSGYISKDTQGIVLDKRSIAKQYLKTFFIVDLAGAINYGTYIHYQLLSEKYMWIELFSFLKFLRLLSWNGYYRQVAKRFRIGFVVRKAIALLICTMLFLHWIVCILLLVALLGEVYDPHPPGELPPGHVSWARKVGLATMSREAIWRICLLRTVAFVFGCSDPFVFSQIQDLVVNIIVLLLGSVIGVFTAVQVIVISRTAQAARAVYRELEMQLREYLRYKRVPRALKQRVLHYFSFCYEQTYYDEAAIMSFVSNHLRQEILLHKSRLLLETVEIFRELTPPMAVRLMAAVEEQVALTNEVIVFVGTPLTRMYYVVSGTVAIFDHKGDEVWHMLEGGHCGDAGLLKDGLFWEASAVALETTRLWRISGAAFRSAVAAADGDLLRRLQTASRLKLGLDVSKPAPAAQAHPHARPPAPDEPSELTEFVQLMRKKHDEAELERQQKKAASSHYSSIVDHEATGIVAPWADDADAEPEAPRPTARRDWSPQSRFKLRPSSFDAPRKFVRK